MTARTPVISRYMTPAPYTIGPNAPLSSALRTMETLSIHHLPVLLEQKIVGLLSLYDLKLLITHAAAAFDQIQVKDLMQPNPYLVSPETRLSTVMSHMAERRINTALVVQEDGSLIGIFTAADALHAFAEVLQQGRPASPLQTSR